MIPKRKPPVWAKYGISKAEFQRRMAVRLARRKAARGQMSAATLNRDVGVPVASPVREANVELRASTVSIHCDQLHVTGQLVLPSAIFNLPPLNVNPSITVQLPSISKRVSFETNRDGEVIGAVIVADAAPAPLPVASADGHRVWLHPGM